VSKPFSIYIHIPFCIQKCPYCDFNTYAVSKAPEKEYVSGLLAELDFRASLPEWKGRTVQTIFFGGGTPSIFSGKAIKNILSHTTRLFPMLDYVEVSLEANPGTVATDNLSEFYDAGVNRLSFGAQSFNTATLKTLGRTHSPDQIIAAVESSRASLFSNISIDLIFAVPGQTIHDVRFDCEQALLLDVPHVSTYSLTIEKGTPFYQSYKRGIFKPISDDLSLEMMDTIQEILFQRGQGLERYEISNYAKPGKEARHNMAYWNGDDYLGVGAGAHSFCKDRRWSNIALPQSYVEKATSQGTAESWEEKLTVRDQIFEYFFLGLRKIHGVSMSEFERRFQTKWDPLFGDLIDILSTEKLIIQDADCIRLSQRGLEIADSVIENFSKLDLSAL
jgi:oxygen-independent coproporphyrinogen-3 oxidase